MFKCISIIPSKRKTQTYTRHKKPIKYSGYENKEGTENTEINSVFAVPLWLKKNTSQRNRQLQLPSQSHLNNLLKRGESHFLDVVFYFGDVAFVRSALGCKLLLCKPFLQSSLLNEKTQLKGFVSPFQFIALGSSLFAVLLVNKLIKCF